MLKLILKGLVILVVVIAVTLVSAAIVIPKKKSFSQETEINASREVIWQVLNDRANYTKWQDNLKSVEVRDSKNWIEYTQNTDPIEFMETSSEEPVSLRFAYKMGEEFRGSWTGELRRIAPDKTVIRTTDKTEVDSVTTKLMMAVFFDIKTFSTEWVQKLKKRAETLQAEQNAVE